MTSLPPPDSWRLAPPAQYGREIGRRVLRNGEPTQYILTGRYSIAAAELALIEATRAGRRPRAGRVFKKVPLK